MDVLIEVHDEGRTGARAAAEIALIGINNRNLKTSRSIWRPRALAPRVPADRTVVAESGLYARPTWRAWRAVGAALFPDRRIADAPGRRRGGHGRALLAAKRARRRRRRRRRMAEWQGFTHFDDDGKAVMVDVSDKDGDRTHGRGQGQVGMAPETLALIRDGGVKKGDVLAVARLAGIMGAKRTPDLIPLCHPLALTSVKVELTARSARNAVDIDRHLQGDRPRPASRWRR